MELKDRVKYFRKTVLNLSQAEFADKLNISRANMANIENGRIKATDRVIDDICRVFHINENWLREGVEPMNDNDYDPFTEDILKICETLDEDNRKYLRGYAQRLLEEQQEKE